MKSLALWYKPIGNKPTEPSTVEMHVNLWKLPAVKKKEFERFIDIGLLVKNAKSVKELCIFYPTKIDKTQVFDLGDKIVNSTDVKLLNTLFNANFNKTHISNSNYWDISNSSNEKLFSIYKLEGSNITVSEYNGGTKISICFKGKVQDNTYIRIRINHDYTSLLSHIDKPSNAIFQSAFSKTEIIDFRINEARELSNELLQDIETEGVMYFFSKIHFFFICSSREEFLFSHVPFISARQLEKGRWKNYIGLKNLKSEAVLAYHWKEKQGDNPINDFNALVQTKYENNSRKTIFKYVIILMLLSILFNLISNVIYNGSLNAVKPNEMDSIQTQNSKDSTTCKQ